MYNTTYSYVSHFEKELFDLKQQRYNPPMRTVVAYIQHLKGLNKAMTDDETLKWLDKLLTTTS